MAHATTEALAIDGGPAVCADLDWRRWLIGTDERQAVLELMDRSIAEGLAFDRYGGTEVDAYEQELAVHVGVGGGTAVSSGTAAIHSIVGALHLEPGSEVICPPLTDTGSVAPVVMQQCVPIFADAVPGSFNLSAETVEAALTDRTAAIIAAHIAGEVLDMDPLVDLAARRGLPLIEDAAQAHGAEYRGRQAGSMGTAGVFSLMGGKHHTAGGQGGMVVSDNAELLLDAKRFADRGKPFGADGETNLFLGLNYRMTELEAAIGRVQLRKLPAMVSRRRALVNRLRELLQAVPAVSLPELVADTAPAYWFVRVEVDTAALRVDKAQFVAALNAEGVRGSVGYGNALVSRQRWIRERRTLGGSQLPWSLPGYDGAVDYQSCCPQAVASVERCMMLSINESLQLEDIDLIAAAYAKVAEAYRA